MFDVGVLDVLRVKRGQAGEDQQTDHRDREGQHPRAEEQVHDRRDDQADQTHHQERAHAA